MRPFFSIIIPTRNRSAIVTKAIESVINQQFKDWELLIIDNDISDATELAVKKYLNEKIKYFRTGNLPIYDNWEYGINKTNGRYITVLEDKGQLFPDSLEIIFQTIQTYKVPIVSWGKSLSEEFKNENELETKYYSSSELLQYFLSLSLRHSIKMLPRFLNSCCESSIIAKSRDTKVGRVFAQYDPDYTSAFMQLAFFEGVIYIKNPLVYYDMRYSNGVAFQYKLTDSFEYNDLLRLTFKNDINMDCICNLTPLKIPTIIYNALINDYLSIREKIGGKLKYFEVNLYNYYLECYKSIISVETVGVDMTVERKLFFETLNQQSEELKQYMREEMEKENSYHNRSGISFTSSFFDHYIADLVKEKKTIALWGAGRIASYLLNNSKSLAENLKYIVDKNTRKHYLKFENWDLTIKPISYLLEEPVDVIVVSSIEFVDEIIHDIKNTYQLTAQIISLK